MTVGVTIPDAKSPDWFERLCANRGWVIVDGIEWVKHADEYERWFGAAKTAPNAKRMPQGVRA